MSMNLRQLHQAIILACQRLHAQIIQNSLDGMVNRTPRCIYVQGQLFQMNKSSNVQIFFIVLCDDKDKIKLKVNLIVRFMVILSIFKIASSK